jgi:hypothetical protein
MASKSKATTIGNYIRKVNGCDIRQKVSYKKGRELGTKQPQVATSEYIVVRGRNVIKNGIKNIETAIEIANAQ